MKKIFITGGTGFIGNSIVKKLQKIPEVSVYILSRKEKNDFDNIKYVRGDIADDQFLQKSLSYIKPDVLLHLAWDVKDKDFSSSEKNYLWVKWSESLVNIFLNNGGKHVVVSGTCFEYDLRSVKPHSENESPIPTTIYGKCKVLLWEKLERLCDEHHARLVWGRIFYPYGEGEESRKFISSALLGWKRGEIFQCKRPDDVIDYIYVDDIAKIFIIFIFESKAEGIINVGTGIGNKVREILAIINKKIYDDNFESLRGFERFVVADIKLLRRFYSDDFIEIEQGVEKLRMSLEKNTMSNLYDLFIKKE